MYRYFFKPIFDFLIALIGFIVLIPVFFILIIAIKLDSRGPILFKQRRVGKHKKIFRIYKFRTMRIDTPHDVPTHLLDRPDQYITRVGKFLRKTSLDELPQILNILFGKMSIIGPRPALWNQTDLIEEREKCKANAIRPGLTGLAQVSGRDALTIAEKAALDGKYARKMNPFLDIKIFFMTILKVFKHEGVVEGGTGALNESAREGRDTPSAADGIEENAEHGGRYADIGENEKGGDGAEEVNCDAPSESVREVRNVQSAADGIEENAEREKDRDGAK